MSIIVDFISVCFGGVLVFGALYLAIGWLIAPGLLIPGQKKPPPPSGNGPYITPLVRKLADDLGVDLASVTGTGVDGRIRKQDVLDHCASQRKREEAARQQLWEEGKGQHRGAATPCPKCNRNHFSDKCPPVKGYRVTDGRTGEVIGHWTPGGTHADRN